MIGFGGEHGLGVVGIVLDQELAQQLQVQGVGLVVTFGNGAVFQHGRRHLVHKAAKRGVVHWFLLRRKAVHEKRLVRNVEVGGGNANGGVIRGKVIEERGEKEILGLEGVGARVLVEVGHGTLVLKGHVGGVLGEVTRHEELVDRARYPRPMLQMVAEALKVGAIAAVRVGAGEQHKAPVVARHAQGHQVVGGHHKIGKVGHRDGVLVLLFVAQVLGRHLVLEIVLVLTNILSLGHIQWVRPKMERNPKKRSKKKNKAQQKRSKTHKKAKEKGSKANKKAKEKGSKVNKKAQQKRSKTNKKAQQ